MSEHRDKENVPKLRFPGFTGEWEQRKLGEISEFNPKSILPDEFEYVDLESVVGTDLIAHRTETKESAPSRAQRLAQRGDVFYQTVRPYQRNNYLYDLPYDNYVFSTGYAQMRPSIDSYFLLSYVQEELFVKNVLDRSTGTSYPAINSNDLAEIEINVPIDSNEQVKIGSLFRNIDHLITLHQRELDNTKKFKAGLLQKMFPKNGEQFPEIRFPGFTDAWEQRRFSDMYKVISGYAFKMSDYVASGIPIINGEAIQHNKVESSNLTYLPKSFFEKYSNLVLSKGDIVIGLNRPIINGQLKIARIPFDLEGSLLYQRAGKIQILRFTQEDFSYTLLDQEILKFTLKEAVGSDQPFISTTKLNNWKFLMPSSTKEQAQIGTFFSDLDHLITLHQRKLEHLQKLKKALLQQMFV